MQQLFAAGQNCQRYRHNRAHDALGSSLSGFSYSVELGDKLICQKTAESNRSIGQLLTRRAGPQPVTAFSGESSNNATHHVVAGIFAGSVTALMMSPLDVIRTRLQIQNRVLPVHLRAAGPVDALAQIWRTEGVRGYVRGYSVACVAVPLFWAVYFGTFSTGKTLLRRYFERGEAGRELSWWEQFATTALAAMGSAALCDLVTNPFWVVRTRMQTQRLHALAGGDTSLVQYSHWPRAMASIYRYEGFRSLFKGLLASWLGVSHVAIQFPLYEILKQRLVIDKRAGSSSVSVSSSESGGTSMVTGSRPAATRAQLVTTTAAAAAAAPATATADLPVMDAEGSSMDVLALPPIPTIGAEVMPPPAAGAGAAGAAGAEAVELPAEGGGAAAFMDASRTLHAARNGGSATSLWSSLTFGLSTTSTIPSLLLASTLSKLCASAVTYSHEVVRSRLQDQREFESSPGSRYKGVWDCFRRIAREEGLAGLYSGFSVNLLRALPATAITFGCYETAMDWLQKQDR